jgi:hypothetical protein
MTDPTTDLGTEQGDPAPGPELGAPDAGTPAPGAPLRTETPNGPLWHRYNGDG